MPRITRMKRTRKEKRQLITQLLATVVLVATVLSLTSYFM